MGMVSHKIERHMKESMGMYVNLTRRFDNKTPYFIHPMWCAMTILSETGLDQKLRVVGAITLLYHDVLEDTTKKSPEGLPKMVKKNIEMMTYDHFSTEVKEIFNKPMEIKLFTLYDKISNMLDGSWMPKNKKEQYLNHINYLLGEVERNYGNLNIVKIARGIIECQK